eukprot:4271180-Amphidinium_carterae.2
MRVLPVSLGARLRMAACINARQIQSRIPSQVIASEVCCSFALAMLEHLYRCQSCNVACRDTMYARGASLYRASLRHQDSQQCLAYDATF